MRKIIIFCRITTRFGSLHNEEAEYNLQQRTDSHHLD